MTAQPVLATLRELLRFKGYATPAEIARLAKLDPLYVLRVLNANERLLERSKGRLVKERVRDTLNNGLWADGAYFVARDLTDDQDHRISCGGYLQFNGHADFRKSAEKTIARTYGKTVVVPDTPENRAALVALGCVSSDSFKLDDRLWQEPLDGA